jgi:6-phosphogluconolactonase
MNEKKPEVIICADLDEISAKAAGYFVEIAGKAVKKNGLATVALSGGKTPLALYGLLSSNKKALDWTRMHIFWGDERCVPPEHEESNYGGIAPFIRALEIPQKNVHRIKGEDNIKAARGYEEEISRFFRLDEGEFPEFDLMLLGLGADGHTASIFPGTSAVGEDSLIAVAVYVEKLRSTRITLTPPVIRNARNLLLLVSGPEKAEAFNKAIRGPIATETLPAQITRQTKGRVVWFVDREAAGEFIDT